MKRLTLNLGLRFDYSELRPRADLPAGPLSRPRLREDRLRSVLEGSVARLSAPTTCSAAARRRSK